PSGRAGSTCPREWRRSRGTAPPPCRGGTRSSRRLPPWWLPARARLSAPAGRVLDEVSLLDAGAPSVAQVRLQDRLGRARGERRRLARARQRVPVIAHAARREHQRKVCVGGLDRLRVVARAGGG